MDFGLVFKLDLFPEDPRLLLPFGFGMALLGFDSDVPFLVFDLVPVLVSLLDKFDNLFLLVFVLDLRLIVLILDPLIESAFVVNR